MVTDLDSNGIAETWFIYTTACKSDVSARTMKLVMHQQNKKYIIRGTSQPAKNMIDEEYGGKYNPDSAFKSLPQKFQVFAKKLWQKHLFDY